MVKPIEDSRIVYVIMIPYLSTTQSEREEMLKVIGISSVDDLLANIPEQIRLKKDLALPRAISELELERHLNLLSKRDADGGEYSSFLGAGSYRHFIPAVVEHIAGRSEFYTSYTPYQAEASQGILQVFFEYQSMISEISGLSVTNASMYDGATAMAEAAIMACNINRRKKVIVSRTVHPEFRQVLLTYLKGLNLKLVEVGYRDGVTDREALAGETDERTGAVIIQNPNFFGCLEDMEQVAEISHRKGALFIAGFYPVAGAILKSPGECGADVAVSEGQSLGGNLNFGGYGLGIFSCRRRFIRKMPGRIVSQTVDTEGRRGFVLALQTREQHIRREKATSNICSNEALCCLRAAVHLATLGREGLAQAARLSLYRSHYLAGRLSELEGFKRKFSAPFFNEVVVECPSRVLSQNTRLLKEKIIGGYDLGGAYPELENCMLWSVTETTTKEEIDRLVSVLSKL